MFNSKRITVLTVATAGGMILLATTGCDNATRASYNHAERFAPYNQVRETQQLANTQAAAGARDDATLFPQHFDGTELSSLGTAKLDLMLNDSHSCNPLTIWLSIPNDDQGAVRRRTVGNYLIKHGGLKPEQLAFEFGVNPSTYDLATNGLGAYNKTDTGSASESSSSAASSSSSH